MYRFPLKASRNNPVPKDVEFYMDLMMNKPVVIFPNGKISRKIGIFCTKLRKKGILHISTDEFLHEPIGILKINNVIRPNSVIKNKGRTIEYIFEDTFLPKVDIPEEMDIF